MVPPKKPDLRLIYVAVTRAKHHLDRHGVTFVDELGLTGARVNRYDDEW